MSSSPKFALTSSPSRPSRLGDALLAGNNTGTRQGDEVGTYEVTIEQQKRAEQICDADRKRFRQFYDDELRRKRSKQFHSGDGGGVKSNKAVQEKIRARQEQRVKDDQFREIRKFARRLAWQKQRVKDDQLLERHRLEKLRTRAGRDGVQRLNAPLQAQKAQHRSLTEGRGVAFDGVVPSFLDEEYQYMKQASTNFLEDITPCNQMRCMRDYQSAISDASRRLPYGVCGGLFQEDEIINLGLRNDDLQYFL